VKTQNFESKVPPKTPFSFQVVDPAKGGEKGAGGMSSKAANYKNHVLIEFLSLSPVTLRDPPPRSSKNHIDVRKRGGDFEENESMESVEGAECKMSNVKLFRYSSHPNLWRSVTCKDFVISFLHSCCWD
jgi:hypothetical protein